MRPPSLADTATAAALQDVQARLLTALRDPDGGTDEVDRDLFLDPPTGTVEGRWGIYRNAYVVRLAEAIENDFPAIARIAGAAHFQALCRRYLTACPPHSHDIGRAGERLAEYLPDDPISAALPFLPDLARFEWALAEAIAAPDSEPARWSDVAALSAEHLAATPLELAPATVLIVSEWPLPSLWLAKDQPDSAVDIPLEGRGAAVLVSRRGLEPRWRVIDADVRALVEGALHGATPADLLEAGAFGDGHEASVRLVHALQRVVDCGALRPLSHSGVAESAPHSKETP